MVLAESINVSPTVKHPQGSSNSLHRQHSLIFLPPNIHDGPLLLSVVVFCLHQAAQGHQHGNKQYATACFLAAPRPQLPGILPQRSNISLTFSPSLFLSSFPSSSPIIESCVEKVFVRCHGTCGALLRHTQSACVSCRRKKDPLMYLTLKTLHKAFFSRDLVVLAVRFGANTRHVHPCCRRQLSYCIASPSLVVFPHLSPVLFDVSVCVWSCVRGVCVSRW